MAKLTDEEKAKLIAGDVEENAETDETTGEQAAAQEEDQPNHEEVEEQTGEEESKEEASAESTEDSSTESESSQSFTKQFPNLKGGTWEDYGKELETAYINSSNEALRIKKQWDDIQPVLDQARQIIANASQPITETKQTQTPQTQPDSTLLGLESHPAVQYAQAQMNREMVSTFDEFTKSYPQAREADEFKRFTDASTGVAQAYADSHNGAQPTYKELYQGIANILGWTPTTVSAKKDAAIKDATTSSSTVSTTQPSAKRPKVTDAQVEAYQRMFPTKDRPTIVKELSEVVT